MDIYSITVLIVEPTINYTISQRNEVFFSHMFIFLRVRIRFDRNRHNNHLLKEK